MDSIFCLFSGNCFWLRCFFHFNFCTIIYFTNNI